MFEALPEKAQFSVTKITWPAHETVFWNDNYVHYDQRGAKRPEILTTNKK